MEKGTDHMSKLANSCQSKRSSMAYGIKYADSAASAEYYHPHTLVTRHTQIASINRRVTRKHWCDHILVESLIAFVLSQNIALHCMTILFMKCENGKISWITQVACTDASKAYVDRERENLPSMWWQHSRSLCLPNNVELITSYSRIDTHAKVELVIISHHLVSIALYIIQGGGPWISPNHAWLTLSRLSQTPLPALPRLCR